MYFIDIIYMYIIYCSIRWYNTYCNVHQSLPLTPPRWPLRRGGRAPRTPLWRSARRPCWLRRPRRPASRSPRRKATAATRACYRRAGGGHITQLIMMMYNNIYIYIIILIVAYIILLITYIYRYPYYKIYIIHIYYTHDTCYTLCLYMYTCYNLDII